MGSCTARLPRAMPSKATLPAGLPSSSVLRQALHNSWQVPPREEAIRAKAALLPPGLSSAPPSHVLPRRALISACWGQEESCSLKVGSAGREVSLREEGGTGKKG